MRALVLLLLAQLADPAGPIVSSSAGSTAQSFLGDFEFLPARGPAWTECSSTTPVNMALRSQTFDNGTWQLADAKITKGAADAVVAPDTTTTADRIVIAASPTSDSNTYQTIGTLASTQYTFSVYLWTEAGTQTVRMARNNSASWVGGTVSTTLTLTTTPTRYSLTFTTGAAETLSNVSIGGEGVTPFIPGVGTFVAWGAQVQPGSTATTYIATTSAAIGALYGSRSEQVTFTRNSTATCQTTAGVLSTLAANQPRLEQYGLEIEGASTNICLQSGALSNAAWTNTTVTLSQGDANCNPAPDGTSTAWRMIATGADSRIQQLAIATASANVTGSIYTKKASDNAGSPAVSLYLVSGPATPVAMSLTSAWVRTVNANVATTANADFLIGGGSTFTAADGAICVWGPQLETGELATSYIPTTTTSVTRAVEVVSIAATGKYSDTQGVARSKVHYRGVPTNARQRSISGTTSSFAASNLSPTGFEIYDGTNIRNATGFTSFVGRDVAPRMTWSGVSSSLTEGATTSTGVYDGTWDATATIYLGSQTGTGSFLNGWIRDVCTGDSTTECP